MIQAKGTTLYAILLDNVLLFLCIAQRGCPSNKPGMLFSEEALFCVCTNKRDSHRSAQCRICGFMGDLQRKLLCCLLPS